MPGLLNLPEHAIAAVAGLVARLVKRVNRGNAIFQYIEDGDHFECARFTMGRAFAKLHQARVHAALQQELRVLVNAVMVHAAAGVTPALVAQVELVMLWQETQFEDARMQRVVSFPGAALAAVCLKTVDRHAKRHAGLASVAARAVGKHAATPKSIDHEARIRVVVDEMAGRGDLGAGLFARQVTAGVGRRCIKLQGLQGKVCEVRHGCVGVLDVKI